MKFLLQQVIYVLLFASICALSATLAEDSNYIYIDQTIEVSEEKRAVDDNLSVQTEVRNPRLILWKIGEFPQIITAQVIQEMSFSDDAQITRFRLSSAVPESRMLLGKTSYFFLFDTAKHQRMRTPQVVWSNTPQQVLTTQSLREYIAAKREELKNLQKTVKTQEDTLERLQSDAEVIGKIRGLLRLKEEVEDLTQQSRSVEQDKNALEEFIRIARLADVPTGYNAREAQLQRSTAELAEIAKRGEVDKKRREKEAGSVSQKLKTIEAAKKLNEQALLKRISELKKRNAQRQLTVIPQESIGDTQNAKP